VLGRSPRFLRGPETSKSELLRIDAALAAREPVRSEVLNYRKDGTPFWVEIAATTTTSPSTGPGVSSSSSGATSPSARGSEAAQREQERSMATLFSNLPGMAYRCRQ
jgi:two-component system sensor histidine kinase/response regulator